METDIDKFEVRKTGSQKVRKNPIIYTVFLSDFPTLLTFGL